MKQYGKIAMTVLLGTLLSACGPSASLGGTPAAGTTDPIAEVTGSEIATKPPQTSSGHEVATQTTAAEETEPPQQNEEKTVQTVYVYIDREQEQPQEQPQQDSPAQQTETYTEPQNPADDTVKAYFAEICLMIDRFGQPSYDADAYRGIYCTLLDFDQDGIEELYIAAYEDGVDTFAELCTLDENGNCMIIAYPDLDPWAVDEGHYIVRDSNTGEYMLLDQIFESVSGTSGYAYYTYRKVKGTLDMVQDTVYFWDINGTYSEGTVLGAYHVLSSWKHLPNIVMDSYGVFENHAYPSAMIPIEDRKACYETAVNTINRIRA